MNTRNMLLEPQFERYKKNYYYETLLHLPQRDCPIIGQE